LVDKTFPKLPVQHKRLNSSGLYHQQQILQASVNFTFVVPCILR